jgi:nucleoside-diphosphate-sugar epimerase
MSAAEHVIFGTGAIGLATLDALRRRGITPRMVNRSGIARVPDGVEVIGGDAGDPEFAKAAASGANVIYQTLNPPYAEWAEKFPGLQRSVLSAAQTHGARLVSMENVYMYGRPNGRPLTEDRAHNAHTKKGKVRSAMAVELLEAHARGDVEVAIGRASDYFGPRGGAQSNLGDRFSPPLSPAAPQPCSGISINPTPTPSSPTSAKASQYLASTRMRRAEPGTCRTIRRTSPPDSSSTRSTGSSAIRGRRCDRSRRSC